LGIHAWVAQIHLKNEEEKPLLGGIHNKSGLNFVSLTDLVKFMNHSKVTL